MFTHVVIAHSTTYRVIPDRWKGMSPGQIEEVRRTQKFQRDEKQVHYTIYTGHYTNCVYSKWLVNNKELRQNGIRGEWQRPGLD